MTRLIGAKIMRIDETAVKLGLKFKDAFDAIEKSYALFSDGKSTTPKTTAMKVNDGMFFCFSSHLHGSRFFISKLATFYSSNRNSGIPTIQPRIFVYDSSNGRLLAEIEGRYFAAVRTAISSAIGVHHLLSKPPTHLAILGSGVQAESHAIVLTSLFHSIMEIRIYSPTVARRNKFVDSMQKKLKNARITSCETAEATVKDADVVACVTDSKVPVFSPDAVKEGSLILAVGSMGRDMQEVPDETMARSLVVVDSIAEIENYGEIAGPIARKNAVNVIGEIGEVIMRRKIATSDVIVFKHHGLPVTDAALAEIVYLESRVIK